ncbi:probable chitinase 2 [Sitodiplosis mosellana]|uniref:probable chitinase 2 n=1 Tax=Sitodiplosis mosellana TaxID=263140 RepID=UPI002444F10E|nr:probable chitinase 2 [Sitodiplosis mosellana]
MTASVKRPSHDKVVACRYLPSFPNEGSEISFDLENMDFDLCTHLIYTTTEDLTTIFSREWAAKFLENDYTKLVTIKNKYNHLKISLGIKFRGSTYEYQQITENTNIESFMEFAKDSLLEYDSDGLDMALDYLRGSDVSYGSNHFDFYVAFSYCEKFQKSFKPYNLLLTLSFNAEASDLVPPPNHQYIAVYDDFDDYDMDTDVDLTDHMAENYAALAKNVDYIHFTMLYSTDMNFHGLSDIEIELNQNIDNIWYIIKTVIQSGVNSSKIVMGLQFFGFKLSKNSNDHKLGAVKFEEILGYNEICDFHSEVKDIWQPGTVGVFNPYTLACDEVTLRNEKSYVFLYENTRSIANKVRLMMKYDIAGILASPINNDDYRGACDIPEETFTDFTVDQGSFKWIPHRDHPNFRLLTTINDVIVVTLHEMDRMHATKVVTEYCFYILYLLGAIVTLLALKFITINLWRRWKKWRNAGKYKSIEGSNVCLLENNKSDGKYPE